MKKTLEWANKDCGSQDEDMKDEEVINANENQFKRASYISKPDMGEDFGFMKKRVRLNTVEKDVKEYTLEQDEIDAKKWKGKKFA